MSILSGAKVLKKFQLHRLFLNFLFYFTPNIDDIGILLVCYRDDAQPAFEWHVAPDPLDMDFPCFHGCAETAIDTELMHDEPIPLQIFAERSIVVAFFLGLGRQVEHHNQPHYLICIQSDFTHFSNGSDNVF